MKALKLLPCPFCGEMPRVLETFDDCTRETEFRVACQSPVCVMRPCTLFALSPVAAAANWNHRGKWNPPRKKAHQPSTKNHQPTA